MIQWFKTEIVPNAGIFDPLSIQLPNVTELHHVSFDHSSPDFEVFSDQGRRGRRLATTVEEFRSFIKRGKRSDEENRASLRSFVEAHSKGTSEMPKELLLVEAAIRAQMSYDSQLIFFPSEE